MSAAGDFEACAKVVPEFDAVLAAGLQEAEKAVAAIAAGVAAGSAADLALGDLATNVVFGAVGVQWGSRAFRAPSAIRSCWRAGGPADERGEAGLVAEDTVEPRRQDRLARRRGMAAPGFETAIELPDQAADAALRGALGFGERIEPVNQAFAMNPAQTMKTDIELASVVADDHGVGEKAMRLDAAPC